MSRQNLIIAIDGFSSCGKSTLAKQLAKELGYIYIDTGAMYRAVTLYFMEHNIDENNKTEIESALSHIRIHFEVSEDKSIKTFLNNTNVEEKIRSMEVSNKVSQISAISLVRSFLVAQQQQLGKQGGVVMDGRDIGTVVFPRADIKLFLTAESNVRVQRRIDELVKKGIKIEANEVAQNIAHRDHVDSTRADSPLQKAEDAIVLDNSFLTPSQQLEQVLHIIQKKLNT